MGVVIFVMAIALVYEVFFHAHDVGPRDVMVNGETVEQMDGLVVHTTTWISRAQAQRFLSRIGATEATLPSGTKTIHGVAYVRAGDFAAALSAYGDRSQFKNGRLVVQLKSGEHYTYQMNGDTIRQQEVVVNGRIAGRILAVNHDEATYVPAATVAQILAKAGLPSSWDGTSLRLSESGPVSKSPVKDPGEYTTIAFGQGLTTYAPTYTWSGQRYVPAYSVSAALTKLGWTWSVGDWRFTLAVHPASVTVAREPMVLAFVPFYFGDLAAFQDVMRNETTYNALAADIWTVDSAGALNGSAPAGAASQAAAGGDAVYAMVSNLGSGGADSKEMTAILSNPEISHRLQSEIVQLVTAEGYDGATLDFESIPPADRALYTTFVADLAGELHAAGKRLQVVVPPDTGSSNEPWNAGYDQAKLGAAADEIVVMAYDYSYPGSPPGPIAPIPWVQETLAYTVSRVPAQKVVLGIDTYGYDWAGKHTTAVGLPEVATFMAAHHLQERWDATAEAPWFTWTDSHGSEHTVYYENAKSTAAKLTLTRAYGLAGVAIWRAGLENRPVLNVLGHYAAGMHP